MGYVRAEARTYQPVPSSPYLPAVPTSRTYQPHLTSLDLDVEF
jgi:hypothetical protein